MRHLVRIIISLVIFLLGLVFAPYVPAAPTAFRWERYADVYQSDHIIYLPIIQHNAGGAQ